MTTHASVNRRSPSGPKTSVSGIMAIASTAVALTAQTTATGTFAGARTGHTVTLNPRANLNGSLSIAWSRIVANDTICIAFNNIGASTNTGAITFDVTSRYLDT